LLQAENVKGNNLKFHEQANYEATKATSNPDIAAAWSAAREQFKQVGRGGSWGVHP
jgi:hypothetical protein